MLLYLCFVLVGTVQRILWAFAPTNAVARFVRTRRGHKWAVPIAVVLVPTYLWAFRRVADLTETADSLWLDILALVLWLDALKMAVLAVVGTVLLIRARIREWLWRRGRPA